MAMRRGRAASDPDFSDQDASVPLPDALDQDPQPRRTRTTKGRTGTRGKIPVRTADGKIMSAAAMRAQVHDELVMYFTIMRGGLALRDECAEQVTDEQLEALAAPIVSMIARNDKLLAKAAQTGIIGDIVRLLLAGQPIVRLVWAHHGPNGDRHGKAMGDGERDEWASQYPAPALA